MKKAILILLILIYNATYAQVSSSLSIRDTRAVNDLPNFSTREIRADFKERSTIGVPGGGLYSTNLTLSPWGKDDNTGEKNYQINFNSGGIFYRNAFPLDAQWGAWRQILVENENGKVGVGTTDPVSKLSVSGSLTLTSGLSNSSARPSITANTLANGEIRGYNGGYSLADDGFIRMSAGGGTNGTVKSYIELSGYSTIPDMDRNIVMGTSGIERLRIDKNGNAGVGTTDPVSKLSISGSLTLTSGLSNTSARPSITANTLANGEIRGYNGGYSLADDGFIRMSAGGGTNGTVKSYIELSGYSNIPDMDRNIVMGTSGNEQLRIDKNGNVGIGSTKPDSKLTVKGKIHAEEVKVDLAVPADYVFEKYYLGESSLKPDYSLLTLSEVEKFTKEKHHLPNVPSANEIKENGLLLGEMSNVLLQKIEELTLYVIEQNKEIETLKKENESFKTLSERFSKIENQLKTTN